MLFVFAGATIDTPPAELARNLGISLLFSVCIAPLLGVAMPYLGPRLSCSLPYPHVIDHSLAELEQRLDGRRFVRIHRAAIVNLAYVQELYPGVDVVIVRLKDEPRTELAVARDRVRDLRAKLGI